MKKRRLLTKLREPERWRRYRDTDIFVSDQGRCKKIYNGIEYEIGYWGSDSSKRTHLVKINSTRSVPIKNLVWETFKGEIPNGYCVVHKGMKRDDSIYSLDCIPRKEHGSRTGKISHSQKVVDLDRRIIYRSTAEAGRRLNCSRSAIGSICRGEVKKTMFNVAWWDEENEKAYRGEWNEGIAH